jgi:hypothetical protein
MLAGVDEDFLHIRPVLFERAGHNRRLDKLRPCADDGDYFHGDKLLLFWWILLITG